MATRSMIGMVQPDGNIIKAVYCHWDGYPAYVGNVLKHHYHTEDSVVALLDCGDISSLGDTLSSTKFIGGYQRLDNGVSTDVNSAAQLFTNINEAYDYYESMWCEWFYKFDDGIWWARSRDSEWRSLAGILEDVREESDESQC